MKLLEERIRQSGEVLSGNVLKVGSFLNQQMDIDLLGKLCDEFHRLYKDAGITKIVTIEASGIAAAAMTAERFGCNVVFAKKAQTSNVADELYHAPVFSFTHGQTYDAVLPRPYLSEEDTVLIIDDFLANGSALGALVSICEQAGSKVAGCGILVEKAFQDGGKQLRERGIRIESLAMIASMDENGIRFCE